MKLEVFDSIGLPQLIVSSEGSDKFSMSVSIPMEVMAQLARVCARRLLQDGDIGQRADMVLMAKEIVDAYGSNFQ